MSPTENDIQDDDGYDSEYSQSNTHRSGRPNSLSVDGFWIRGGKMLQSNVNIDIDVANKIFLTILLRYLLRHILFPLPRYGFIIEMHLIKKG